jgi:hypothetical protein
MTENNWGTDEEIWQTISPPMIPSVQDVELVRRSCPPELMDLAAAPRILVLGVTPALVDAGWPARAELHAVDYDPAMIELLWKPRASAQCHCAHWQAMPFSDGYFDLVVGDCSFNALPGLQEYDAVLREIARVKRPIAPLVARFFMQPEPRLTLALLQEYASSKFAGFGAAAMRLMVAFAASAPDGSLEFRDIPTRIREQWGSVDEYLAAIGQSPDAIARANKTYLIDQRLNYPDRHQILLHLEPYFREISFNRPNYDCGEFCPIVACFNP